MNRQLFFAYGVFCHLAFLVVFAYFMAFVGGFLVPKTVDSRTEGSVVEAIAIDLLLLGLFAIQHSVMARPGFKRLWTRILPEPIERSTYVLASCIVTVVMMWQWKSVPFIMWDFSNPVLRFFAWSLFVTGWVLVPMVTLLINHFDLFGTRQVWLYVRNQPYTSLPFREPSVYKRVRHPLYVGWAIAFWSTPTMTFGHFLFALVLTVYMALATILEERDLVTHFGNQYREYQHRVPMFLPAFRLYRKRLTKAASDLSTSL